MNIFKKKWYVIDYYLGDSVWVGSGSDREKAKFVCGFELEDMDVQDERKIAEHIVELHNKSLEKQKGD